MTCEEMTPRRIALSAIILCAVAAPAVARAPNCAGIAEDKDRLACYDKAAKPKEAATPPALPSGAMTEQSRLAFRARLEKAMLNIGMSADVMMENNSSTKIIVFTYLSKAIVYKLIIDGKVLEGAKEAGFKTFDFADKGHEGHWIYDLTKPGNCDVSKRLCY